MCFSVIAVVFSVDATVGCCFCYCCFFFLLMLLLTAVATVSDATEFEIRLGLFPCAEVS